MKQKRYTKRALCMSVLSMLLCCSMLIGTTFAWFTDSVTSGHNKIVAGNLDVELFHTVPDATGVTTTEEKVEEGTELFQIDLWEPGVIVYETFTVKNVGSLALKYALDLNVYEKNFVVEADETVTGKSLADVIKMAVVPEADIPADGFTRENAQSLTYSDLDDIASGGALLPTGKEALEGDTYATKDTAKFAVVLYWQPSDVDDDYNLKNGRTASQVEGMADTTKALFINVGINLYATQYTYESDSFDNQYDADLGLSMEGYTTETDPTTNVVFAYTEEGKTLYDGKGIDVTGNYVVPDDVVVIGENAFAGSDKLSEITIPNSVKKIGEWAFGQITSAGAVDGSLVTIHMGNGVVEIGERAFKGAAIGAVELPDTLTTLGEGAFMQTNLESIKLPDSLTVLPKDAFHACGSLATVTLGNAVTEIGENALRELAITSITLPETVKKIGEWAFRDCTNLTEVTCEWTEVPADLAIASNAFMMANGSHTVTLKVQNEDVKTELEGFHLTNVTVIVERP